MTRARLWDFITHNASQLSFRALEFQVFIVFSSSTSGVKHCLDLKYLWEPISTDPMLLYKLARWNRLDYVTLSIIHMYNNHRQSSFIFHKAESCGLIIFFVIYILCMHVLMLVCGMLPELKGFSGLLLLIFVQILSKTHI